MASSMLGGFLLPVLFWLIAYKAFSSRAGDRFSAGESGLVALLLAGVVVAVGVQLLSALHFFGAGGFALLWVGSSFLVILVTYRFSGGTHCRKRLTLDGAMQEADVESRLMAFAIFVLAVVSGVVAVYAIPNNWDSMGYHLARVAYWRQYGSISFFATANPRQNNLEPFAEWAVLQLAYLQGHMTLCNTIQFVAYLGSILCVSEISRLMGASSRECVISAFFCAALPMAVLQATSTQNDLVLSFWLSLAVYGCVRSISKSGWESTAIFGAAVGLALLTKTTALIFATPLGLWFAWITLSSGWKKLACRIVLVGGLVLSLNAGHFMRNLATSASPFGPNKETGQAYTNEIHTPGAIFSNMLRNLALHGQLLQHGGGITTAIGIKIHHGLGLDPFDPRTTWMVGPLNSFGGTGSEDGCPMLVALVTIFMGFAAMLYFGSSRFSSSYFALMGSLLLGAFLFCFVLKWQIWNVRLQLPLFVMGSPVAAAVMARIMMAPVRWIFLCIMVSGAMSYASMNPSRPVFGHDSIFVVDAAKQRYHGRPQLEIPFESSLRILEGANVKSVGLVAADSWEYPLLDPKEDGDPPSFKIDHVLVGSTYAKLETRAVPDAVVCLDQPPTPTMTVHGRTYLEVYHQVAPDTGLLDIGVYLPK